MVNVIWIGLVISSIILSIINGTTTAVVNSITQSCHTAIQIGITLSGIMTLWLGLMRVAEKSGLIRIIAKLINPVMRRLFPKVPSNHPAMGAMMMNISANMLGIGNAATPFGLRAMKQLQTLNSIPNTATNAMCTFLTINTSSVQLIPVTAIAILAATGDPHPTSIIFPTLIATGCSTVVGISAAKCLAKLRFFNPSHNTPISPTEETA